MPSLANFPIAEIRQKLRVGSQKAVKLLRELAGFGLIERKRVGLGHPDKIYVMAYRKDEEFCAEECPERAACACAEDQNSANFEAVPEQFSTIPQAEVETEMQNFESPPFVLPGAETAQSCDKPAAPIKNQTNGFRKNPSYPSATEVEQYREIIKENIEHDWFRTCYAQKEKISGSQEELDELVELMTECAAMTGCVRIHGQPMAAEIVKSRMLKLNSEHIQYVFDCLARTTSKIRNIKAYLLTALFNAPTTIGSYYSNLVRHDLYALE